MADDFDEECPVWLPDTRERMAFLIEEFRKGGHKLPEDARAYAIGFGLDVTGV